MFLATTSDQKYWHPDEKILFLGNWCKEYGHKHIWSERDHQVLPYHWDDREKLNQDCIYLQSIYEKYLESLAEQLNQLHGEKFSNRYWRIILGPWLTYFIPVFYDAYLSIKSASESKLISNTWVPDTKVGGSISYDSAGFLSWILNFEEYHQFLYGWIIKSLGDIPYEIKGHMSTLPPQAVSNKNPVLVEINESLKKIFARGSRYIPQSWNEVIIDRSYIGWMDIVKLRLHLKQFPIPFSPSNIKLNLSCNEDLRRKLSLPSLGSEFESLLSAIIPQQIPLVLMEGYSEMRKRSLADYPKTTKVILSEMGIYIDNSFKFWMAHQVENGAKLTGIQHGGGYGQSLWQWCESHEMKIFDHFFSWGWDDPENSAVIPMPSSQLSNMKKRIKPNATGGIVCVGFSLAPRYLYVMYSAPVSSQLLDYIEDQQAFISSVSSEVHNLLTYRLYPKDDGWDMKKRLADFDPTLNVSRGLQPLSQQLNESRLCIHSYLGTTYLETMAANYPTLIFLNPKHWELKESAKPYFNSLSEVGILHDTPESVASMVDRIYENPMAWWISDEVQEVRKSFCARFAKTNDDWVSEWTDKIQDLIQS